MWGERGKGGEEDWVRRENPAKAPRFYKQASFFSIPVSI